MFFTSLSGEFGFFQLRFGTTPLGFNSLRTAMSLTRRMPNPKVVSSIELVTNPPTQSSSTNTHTPNFKVEWVGGG
jgi:hypothetical protein